MNSQHKKKQVVGDLLKEEVQWGMNLEKPVYIIPSHTQKIIYPLPN
jgi:hypothetical protein